MKAKPFPARLRVLLAREARIGLVLRRGPSKQVATFLWNRDTDDFELGQWMKGQIYDDKSELSPDGKYLIYYAMNGKREQAAKGAWTAVSIVPYVKAIALYPIGNSWVGGGLWMKNDTYWVRETASFMHSTLFESHLARRIDESEFTIDTKEEYHRRTGWKFMDESRRGLWNSVRSFEKQLQTGWILKRLDHWDSKVKQGRGSPWEEYALLNTRTKVELAFPDWEWADLDRNRLIWATNGQLMAAEIGPHGLLNERLLYDFNGMRFKRIKAPY